MPKKILVADDSFAIRSVARSLLSQKGYEVLCASNGAEAWELIRMTKPDLIFLDHSLPDLETDKICEKIKKQSDLKDIPVVVLLGTNEVKKQGKFKDLGVDAFVLKPFTPKEFLTKVELFSELKPSSEQKSSEKKEEKKNQVHGYDWFISEMKKEMGQVLPEKSFDEQKDKKESTEEIVLNQDLEKKALSQEKDKEFKVKELDSRKEGYDNFIFEQKKQDKKDLTTQEVVYTELKFDDEPEKKRSEQKNAKHPSKRSLDVTFSDFDYKEITDKLVEQISTKIAEKIASMIDRKVLEEEIKKRLGEF